MTGAVRYRPAVFKPPSRAVAVHPSRPKQLPLAQPSFSVHALPSEQPMVLFANLQPLAGSQLSVVQAFPSSQANAGPPTHAPPLQASLVVQALLSTQTEVLLTYLQPLAGSQLSVVQGLLSSQFGAAPPLHTPPRHASLVVQALLSLQVERLLTLTQLPVPLLQLSPVQPLPSLQDFGWPATHLAAEHASPTVHASPSLHAAELLTYAQVPFATLQLSLVQALLSSHGLGDPDLQVPLAQTSAIVHGFVSSQLAVLAGNAHLPLSHKSLVHALPSLQSAGLAQLPPQPVLGCIGCANRVPAHPTTPPAPCRPRPRPSQPSAASLRQPITPVNRKF